jgi:hypothetical protein
VSRTWLVIALLLSLGVNLGLAGAILVRSRALEVWRGERMPPDPGERIAGRLGLEGENRRRFVAVQRHLVEQVQSERDEIVRLRGEIRRELLADQPDRAKIDSLLDQLAGHEAALNRAFVGSVLDSRATLSGDALERYLQFVDRVGPGRGPGEGPPDDPRFRPGLRRRFLERRAPPPAP